MTILVTLERYIAVCWPMRAKALLTKNKAGIGTVLVIIFAILLNIPRWLEVQTDVIESYNFYFERDEPVSWKIRRNTGDSDLLIHTNYRTFYHGVTWVTLMYAIPIPALTWFNVMIWKQVSKNYTSPFRDLRCLL